jgi:hypothetical protein
MKETHTMSTTTSPQPPAHFPADADTSLVAATEFGDHPDAAASRMRWVRQLAHVAGGGR